MVFWLFILFVIAPIVEIYVLLKAGAAFGALQVVAACLFTAALGGWLLRAQGLAVIRAIEKDLSEGRAPVAHLVDSALLLVAAPLLMTPGFITDAAGFSLLVPVIRRFIRNLAAARLQAWVDARSGVITINRP